MPFTLSTLISGHVNRFPSRSPTSSRSRRTLYFPPGGHTHDRHTIPPDRLHISLSDPVLVAAEQRLSNVLSEQRRSRLSIIKDASARKAAKLGSVVFHLKGGLLSQRSSDYNDGPLVAGAVSSPFTMATDTQGTSPGHCWKVGFQGTAAYGPSLLDPSDDSCDISEVVLITNAIDGSPGNTHSSASDHSRYGSDLAPLASEMFKEELYIRGYLKTPASRPSNVVPRKSRTNLVFVGRKVFPRVLGRRQGRKVADCLRVGQDTAETPDGFDPHFPEKHPSTSVACVTLQTLHADGLKSPGTDINTSASESFGLHEFSYITAFTTPPSSPSIVLDAETFKKGVDLGDRKHAI